MEVDLYLPLKLSLSSGCAAMTAVSRRRWLSSVLKFATILSLLSIISKDGLNHCFVTNPLHETCDEGVR